MAICKKCNQAVEEGIKFCPACGSPMEEAPAETAAPAKEQPVKEKIKGGSDYTDRFEAADIAANKTMALLAYIIFFIPLLAAKDSAYAKFHANQGLVLLLAGIIVSIAGSIIPILGWFLILPIGGIFIAVFGIMGMINAWKGFAKEMPVIGKFRIIK